MASRIGPADADVLLFNKGSRDERFARLQRCEATPREFFYGFLDIRAAGYSVAMLSSDGAVDGTAGLVCDKLERAFAKATGLGVRPLSTWVRSRSLSKARVLISFTDGFSLSLGLGYPRGGPSLIGGFQGLGDIEARAPRASKALVRELIRRSLTGLDHAFFLSSADRARSIERYGAAPDRTSLLIFGVDTEFWRPGDAAAGDEFLAVGQDANRDFDTLASAPGGHPTLIITRRAVKVPVGAWNVRVMPGGFANSAISDEQLRSLYQRALAVVVPTYDVFQPSGQSVALQAMSCGRPVILSRSRGLWDSGALVHGKNCLLVPPLDASALGAAMSRIRTDPDFARQLGKAARETVAGSFGLDVLGRGAVGLVERGFAALARRSRGRAA